MTDKSNSEADATTPAPAPAPAETEAVAAHGRGRPTPIVGRAELGWRSDSDIDSDRLLYSPEFRRLEGVTQVVPPQDDYVFHDRLTHSLKVAQVATSTARKLVFGGIKDLGIASREMHEILDPGICYVAGLAHDIGHPPFGHAAESQLQIELGTQLTMGGMSKRPILLDSFEGNAQSFRIVTKTSFRKDVDLHPQEGLNLTWRSLAAIAKYPWLRGGHPKPFKKTEGKWSIYATESVYLDSLVEQGLVAPKLDEHGNVIAVRRSVEAEVMDWADDISYAVHDLEDFFRAGRIPLDRIRRLALEAKDIDRDTHLEWTKLFTYALGKISKLEPEIGRVDANDAFEYLIDEVIPVFPEDPFDGTRRSHAALQQFGSYLIVLLQRECDLQVIGDHVGLNITRNGRIAAEFLKSITQYYLIHDAALETMQAGQRKAISELFGYLHGLSVAIFIDSAGSREAERRVPARLREYAIDALSHSPDEFKNDEARMARAVTDYMCGLTDKQAILLHQRVMGISSASYSSRWLNV